MEQNNAARRLCNILERAIANGKDDKIIYQVIAEALAIKAPDSNKYAFTEFFVLLAEVEHITKQLKKVRGLDKYIEAVQEIQSIFFTYGMFQGQWNSVRSTIEGRNLILGLDACANFIAQEKIDPSLGEEQLKEYLQQCEALLQEVMESDLSEDIKTFLVVRLEEICTAIRHYSLGGPERLRTVVEANIGGIILRSAAISSQDKEKPIFQKIFGWLLTLGGVLDLASNTQGYLLPKVAEITKYLLPPS
ncbi:MAG: hypothetical protein KME16_03560 [Scytolyngbya sp. HA4215-MV1]|jgi:hypothetical protein|nr:hypothetical protein [Scytolyngbya sp. HA4215-MV1]